MSRCNLGRAEGQGAPRLGYGAYGISRERYLELRNGCRAGRYAPETLRKACRGLGFIEPWIILSVTKGLSYDLIEYSGLGVFLAAGLIFMAFGGNSLNLDVALREGCSE